MEKFRGSRGVRNYILEAYELKKPVIILTVICVCTLFLAGALLLYAFIAERREVVPVAAEIYEIPTIFDGEFLFLPDGDKPPIIPICWADGIFYDTDSLKIIMPPGTRVDTVESEFHYRTYTAAFHGAAFSRGSVTLYLHDYLPLSFVLDGDSLTINTRRGVFLEHGDTENYSYIQLVDPRELFHTIVVVDAGHGGEDPGATANGIRESDINLAVSQRLLEIFDEPGVLLIPTRTGDYSLTTSERTQIANSIGDYFISIHCNADERSRNSRGTVTLYGTSEGSRELAEIFQSAMVSVFESQDRGIVYAPQFYILRSTRIPVVLLELLFVSNPQDAAQLADPSVQTLTAEAIADLIRNLPPAR